MSLCTERERERDQIRAWCSAFTHTHTYYKSEHVIACARTHTHAAEHGMAHTHRVHRSEGVAANTHTVLISSQAVDPHTTALAPRTPRSHLTAHRIS
eukprot:2091445-Rhodomonas_salina.1